MAIDPQTHPMATGLAFELEPPSLEALHVNWSSRPSLFPYSPEYDPDEPFATNILSTPREGQPLGEFFFVLEAVKHDRNITSSVLPSEQTQVGREAIDIQLNLTKAIHRIYLNFLYQRGESPFDIPDLIAAYADKADDRLYRQHKEKEDRYLAILECLGNGYMPDIDDYWLDRTAYTDVRKSADPPAYEEVIIEGAKEGAARELEKSRLHLARLKFESMSTMVILQALREGMSPDAIGGISRS